MAQLMKKETFDSIILEAKRYKHRQEADVVRYLVDTAYQKGFEAGIDFGKLGAKLQEQQTTESK